MRQWMTDTETMCDKHLLGEHVEHHMFVGSIHKGKSLKRYISDGLLDARTLESRHCQIAKEMQRRGMNHKSPLPVFTWPSGVPFGSIDPKRSTIELLRRCPGCRSRFNQKHGSGAAEDYVTRNGSVPAMSKDEGKRFS